MLDNIIRWSLRNRLLVVVASAVLLLAGTYTAWRMPVDVFPDLTAPTVTVITEAHGMAPTEVESQITFPIEATVNATTRPSGPAEVHALHRRHGFAHVGPTNSGKTHDALQFLVREHRRRAARSMLVNN